MFCQSSSEISTLSSSSHFSFIYLFECLSLMFEMILLLLSLYALIMIWMTLFHAHHTFLPTTVSLNRQRLLATWASRTNTQTAVCNRPFAVPPQCRSVFRWTFLSRSAARLCSPQWSSVVTTPPLQTSKMFWSPGGTGPSARTLCWSTTPQVSSNPRSKRERERLLIYICSMTCRGKDVMFLQMDSCSLRIFTNARTKKFQ